MVEDQTPGEREHDPLLAAYEALRAKFHALRHYAERSDWETLIAENAACLADWEQLRLQEAQLGESAAVSVERVALVREILELSAAVQQSLIFRRNHLAELIADASGRRVAVNRYDAMERLRPKPEDTL